MDSPVVNDMSKVHYKAQEAFCLWRDHTNAHNPRK